MYRLHFKPTNIKKIPFKSILWWLFLTLLLVLLFIEAFVSAPKRFDSVHEKQITVERIGFKGHRPKNLIVYAEDQTYYMETGTLRAQASVRAIREAWENGTISSGDTVTVQFIDKSCVPFQPYTYKNLIVGLQTDDTVYYELDTAKKISADDRVAATVIFFLILLFWTVITYILLLAYNIVDRRKLTKEERKGMRKNGK